MLMAVGCWLHALGYRLLADALVIGYWRLGHPLRWLLWDIAVGST